MCPLCGVGPCRMSNNILGLYPVDASSTMFSCDKKKKNLQSLLSVTQLRTIVLSLGGFPGSSVVKNLPPNAGDAEDMGSIPGSGRSPGVGNTCWLQYSCLENPMDSSAWRATVHEVPKSRTVQACMLSLTLHRSLENLWQEKC